MDFESLREIKLFFKQALFFSSACRFTAKLRESYRDFLCTLLATLQPSTLSASCTGILYSLQLINLHWHPQSVVYIRVPSRCNTFCHFRRMYDDMYPPFQSYLEQFYCPKVLCKCNHFGSYQRIKSIYWLLDNK